MFSHVKWFMEENFLICNLQLFYPSMEVCVYVCRRVISSSFHCRLPAPIAVLISAAVFAVAHFTPEEFPQLFVLGMINAHKFIQRINELKATKNKWNFINYGEKFFVSQFGRGFNNEFLTRHLIHFLFDVIWYRRQPLNKSPSSF